MLDDIIVSGGGSTQVAPDRLIDAEARLAGLAGGLRDLAHDLRPALALASVPDAARLAGLASAGLIEAAGRAAALSGKVKAAAEDYGRAERAAASRTTRLGELGGWLLGVLAPFEALLGTAALPGILVAAFAAFATGTVLTGSPGAFLREVGGVVERHAGLLRDPRVVSLVRLVVSSADDAMLGAVGVPLVATRLLDDRGTGGFGLHGAAGVIVGAGRLLGLLEETPVEVRRVAASSSRVPPPSSYRELAARIPRGGDGGAQVRVERYAVEGGRHVYLAYVGGTVTMSPRSTTEPFDLASNMAGMARLDPAAARAAEEALRSAGAEPGDTVIPVGYSQGGIVATGLATSGTYDTPALVTFGSPTGGVDVPSGVVDVAVEHVDDLVPALGGEPREAGDGGADRILVTRRTYEGEVPIGSSPVEAHLLEHYEETASQMDASRDPRLAAALAALPAGGTGKSELYRGVRGAGPALAAPVPLPATGPMGFLPPRPSADRAGR